MSVGACGEAGVEAACLPQARRAGPELGGLGTRVSGCGHGRGQGTQASVERAGGTQVSPRQWKAGLLARTWGCSGAAEVCGPELPPAP